MAHSFTAEDLRKAKEALTLLGGIGNSQSSSQSQPAVDASVDASVGVQETETKETKRSKVLEAADKALYALKGMRRGMAGGKRRLKDEVNKAFKKKKTAWKHRFVCLGYYDQPKIPTTDADKDELFKAGLGRKEIEFSSLDMSAEEFRDVLYSAFPKLKEGGGFELCRCLANSRKLELLSSVAHSSPCHLKERVGNARTYIRPLQRDLDLSEVIDIPPGPKQECLTCGLELPLEELKSHVRECEKELGSLSPILPPRHQSPPRSPSNLSDCSDLPPGPFDLSGARVMDEADVVYVDSPPTHPPNSETGCAEAIMVEQEFIQAAMQQSIDDLSSISHEPHINTHNGDVGDVGSEIIYLKKEMLTTLGLLCLTVRRDHFLVDAMREAKKKKFCPQKQIKVTFDFEGAIDSGGPRREFFRLLALKASEHYFEGREGAKFFCNNITAIQNSAFFYLGQYTVMSIAQGGSGFPFLAPPVYAYISSGNCSTINWELEDIADPTLKFAVEKIIEAEDDVDIKTALAIDEVTDLLLQTGYRKPIPLLALTDKREVITALVDYHMMLKVKCAMDQYMSGLEALGLLGRIQDNPSAWKPLFTKPSERLTPDRLLSMFTIKYAEKGSNLRPHQEQSFIHFADFLDECYEGEVECTVEDVMAFFSAASQVPPLGFDKDPTITFNHAGNTVLATASTCDLQLRLPTIHGSIYEDFKEALILSIKGNDGFGGV